ncbi:MAG: DNA cytosine methyltransferase [Candidatus Hydrogenedentota bacterium]
MKTDFTALELCAGAGGQALGLERAGFAHAGLVELDHHCCASLRANRPSWRVVQADLNEVDPAPFKGVDLVAGGLPCPPFSIAGRQLGAADSRNLFPAALRIISEIQPKAVLFENVKGLLAASFSEYREWMSHELVSMGFIPEWRLLNASDYGVPQLRPRAVMAAMREDLYPFFGWPVRNGPAPPTVGEVLYDLMSARGWNGADEWRARANDIAPTIVGGSHKHGGPDLGPTRAKRAWAELGVDGMGVANEAPDPGCEGMPRLTVRMVARLQGFPDNWIFTGGKTAQYRQVGNAFPPPVAEAVATQIRRAFQEFPVERETKTGLQLSLWPPKAS